MYKVTVYMVDDSLDSYFGGEPTVTYNKNENKWEESVVGHMFYTMTDENSNKASY